MIQAIRSERAEAGKDITHSGQNRLIKEALINQMHRTSHAGIEAELERLTAEEVDLVTEETEIRSGG